jgi:transcriptional regulator with XRE-family HTH domain
VSNDKLRTALDEAGLEPEQLAELLQVDVKTVQRWLAGRAPYPRHRSRIARALGREQHELWPDLAPAPAAGIETTDPEAREAVAAYQSFNDPSAPDWHSLLEHAERHIDLLDLTLADILSDGETTAALAERASAGCRVRILLSHRESIHLAVNEAERHPDQRLTARPLGMADIDTALQLLQPLLETSGAQIRTFIAPHYNSIIRVDDQMLVALHLWGTPTENAPLLHLHADGGDGLLARFAEHYDAIWNQAAKPLR